MDARLFARPATARSLDDLLGFARYVVVGANSGGDQVRAWLAAHDRETLAFADLSPRLQGTRRDGLDVLAAVTCLERFGADTAFIIGTVRQCEAAELLIHDLGVDPARVLPFVNPMFAAHYRPGVQTSLASRLARARTFLADDESRAYFDRATSFYRTLDPRHLTPQPKRHGQYGYDALGANPAPGAVIVDCGAFTGDTFADFIAATGGDCRIHALEAFPPNYTRLLDTIARDSLGGIVTPKQVAVAREPGTIAMAGDDAIADGCARASSDSAHEYTVSCDTLDNLFLDTPIDYLKMDIEGADLDALEGGRRMIARHRPVVAVAAYHTPEHAADIADFLHETLSPCRIYAAHDPNWVFHIHYIAVPEERAV